MNVNLTALLFTVFTLAACNTTTPTTPPKTIKNEQQQMVKLSADFTDANQQLGEVFDFFDVSVRTHKGSPHSTPATFGRRAKVNTVRMLGGWADKNISADTYKWNGKEFVYDFEQATKRIDSWLDNNWDIFQIVLDNPPWAFQHGLTFVEQANGKHYLQKDANAVYGNPLPPANPKAWQQYIQAFMQHLVAQYGKDTVLSWRFRVGSEIDTRPQHWAATREEFFAHYQNTVNAIHAVLPTAKVGAHFREASFKGNYLDYTGNTEDAYAPHFISWAKKNNVPYDFLAISYYPHITKPHELDMAAVYHHDMAPIQHHPDWNSKASFEIHEYKLISKMQRAGFVSVATSHSSAFFAMLSKLMLEKNIMEIFQWGTARDGNYIPEAMTQLALHSMVGNELFKNNVSGATLVKDNNVNGIFTKQSSQAAYDLLLFNFNKNNLTYQQPENVNISLKVEQPIGTKYQYRLGRIDDTSNIEQRFIAEFPKANIPVEQGGWRKPDIHVTASVMKALNDEGKKVFLKNRAKYGKSDTLIWSNWKTAETVTSKVENNNGQSNIMIETSLPSFSVHKYEIRMLAD